MTICSDRPSCIVSDCPVAKRPAGCGWLAVGADCHHPAYREAWALAMADNSHARSLVARAQAASREMTPEEARQLILNLEVEE